MTVQIPGSRIWKAAAVYAKAGIRILALRPKSKKPLLENWTTLATTDTNVIAEWAEQYPDANLGAATGHTFFVLDVDPKNGGDQTLAKLEAENGTLPPTAEQQTPSMGRHLLFQMPDFHIGNSTNVGGHRGLDIRGTGGQIVVAPSVTDAGQYRWLSGHNPALGATIATAPEWLLEIIRNHQAPQTAPRLTVSTMEFPPASPEVLEEARQALHALGYAIQGNGGDAKTFVAAALLRNDFALTEAEAWPLLCEWNEECQPPWGKGELQVKLRGGEAYSKSPYGCKRQLDAIAAAKLHIQKWRDAGSSESGIEELVKSARKIIAELKVDPTARAIIEKELQGATGLGARALALPKALVRADPTEAAKSEWFNLDINSNGQPLGNMNNATTLLEKGKSELYFDEFKCRVIGNGKEWTDADDLALTLKIQRIHGITNMQRHTVTDAVIAYAHRNCRNPLLETLSSYVWDGVPRIELLFVRGVGAADNEYNRAVGKNFMRSMTARVINPGCKVDTMPVLEGGQGKMKSTFLRDLATQEYFGEISENLDSKDFKQSLQGKLIMEMAELDAMNRADVTRVKQTLSCAVDRYRPSYGRHVQDFPRQGVLAGTTNHDDWNRDDTGARRFWPVRCEQIDLEWLKENREQLFAEAVHDVHAGRTWWEMPKEATLKEQGDRYQAHPWEEIIRDFLSEKSSVRIPEILDEALEKPKGQLTKADQMTVASILRRLGWKRERTSVDGKQLWQWVPA